MVLEIFEIARTGEPLDYETLFDGTSLEDPAIEVKYVDENLQNELIRYIEHAWKLFTDNFHLKLFEAPEMLIMEVLTATMAELDKKGILRLKKGKTLNICAFLHYDAPSLYYGCNNI